MKHGTILLVLFSLLFGLLDAYPSGNNTQSRANQRIKRLEKRYQKNIHARIRKNTSGCTPENTSYRREWGSLSKKERTEYIDAVKCLQGKPPLTSQTYAPGARSRFDDFIVAHIEQTQFVHLSGLFLPFHRYFVRLYEKALQEECGYTGAQPYWDWTISYQDSRKSPVLDGSPYSLSGDGQYVPHEPLTAEFFGVELTFPPGTGGGCVTSGPFTNYNLSLGPIAFEPKGPDGGLGSNPRCFSRDINTEWSANYTRPSDVLDLLTSCNDFTCFDGVLEKPTGVHAAGHATLGGMSLDPYASAGDPVFWLHHAQVDRLWAIWQGQNLKDRTYQTGLTGTALNNPPSANVTLQTPVNVGVVGPSLPVEDVVSTVDGPLCYAYL